MRSTSTLEFVNATSVYIVCLSIRPYSLKVQPKRVQSNQSMSRSELQHCPKYFLRHLLRNRLDCNDLLFDKKCTRDHLHEKENDQ